MRFSHKGSRCVQAVGASLVLLGIVMIFMTLWTSGEGMARGGGGAAASAGSTPSRVLAAAAVLVCGAFVSMFGIYLRNVEQAVAALSHALAHRTTGSDPPPAWSDLVA